METMELCVTACEKFATNNEVSVGCLSTQILMTLVKFICLSAIDSRDNPRQKCILFSLKISELRNPLRCFFFLSLHSLQLLYLPSNSFQSVHFQYQFTVVKPTLYVHFR